MNARTVAFVLASTSQGTLIVNRFDHYRSERAEWGVGFELLRDGSYSSKEVNLCLALLKHRRQHFGDGVFAVDCGANLGIHTIEWARFMSGWGSVLAVEPQERIFYALCGNIALNNCFNARAIHAAVGATEGEIQVPILDYLKSSSFGSLELRQRLNSEPIGQHVSYLDSKTQATPMICLDGCDFKRLDLIKMDIEGMEEEALNGSQKTIKKLRPILLVERIKSRSDVLDGFFISHGYKTFSVGMNDLAIHQDDPTLLAIKVV